MNPNQSPKNTPNPKQRKKPNHEQFSAYAKYSGLAFQMIAVLGLAVWGGMRLDDYFNSQFPIFLVVLSLLAFASSLYVLIRSLPKNE